MRKIHTGTLYQTGKQNLNVDTIYFHLKPLKSGSVSKHSDKFRIKTLIAFFF